MTGDMMLDLGLLAFIIAAGGVIYRYRRYLTE